MNVSSISVEFVAAVQHVLILMVPIPAHVMKDTQEMEIYVRLFVLSCEIIIACMMAIIYVYISTAVQ